MAKKTTKHRDASMSFGEHLDELRKRLAFALLGFVPIFAVAVAFWQSLLGILLLPVQQQLRAKGLPPVLQATGVTETFFACFHVAAVVTILVGVPWAVWQLWVFVAPGLYKHERKFAYFLAPLSAALTVCAALFLYFIMLPVVLAFFIGFGTGLAAPPVSKAPLPEGVVLPTLPTMNHDPIDPPPGAIWVNTPLNQIRLSMPTGNGAKTYVLQAARDTGILQQYKVSEYVRLVFSLGMGLALGFQMPIVVLLLGWVGIVDRAFLVKHRKGAAMTCAILGAVLTPADPMSMIVLTVPLYALYEFGLLLLRFVPASRFTGEEDECEPADAGDA